MRAPTSQQASKPTVFINARHHPASGRDEPGISLSAGKSPISAAFEAQRSRRRRGDRLQRPRAGARIIVCGDHGRAGAEHQETLTIVWPPLPAGDDDRGDAGHQPGDRPGGSSISLTPRTRQRRDAHNGGADQGPRGREITEIGLLNAPAPLPSNGKNSVANTRVMRNALLYAKDFGALIVHHTEDPYLTEGTCECRRRARLGLLAHQGAESSLERDIRLVEITGGRYPRRPSPAGKVSTSSVTPRPGDCRSPAGYRSTT